MTSDLTAEGTKATGSAQGAIRREGPNPACMVVVLAATLAAGASPAAALEVSGAVRDAGGKPVSGAMVTVEGLKDGPAAVTVFSDDSGAYRISGLRDGKSATGATIHVKKIGFETPKAPNISPKNGVAKIDFVVSPTGNVAKQVPASAWLAALPMGQARYQTVLQCSGCHQFPTDKVRAIAESFASLSEQERELAWRDRIQSMRRRFVNLGPDGSRIFKAENITPDMEHLLYATISEKDENLIAPLLAKHMPVAFDKLEDYQPGAPLGVTKETVIKEFQLPPDSFVREVATAYGSPYIWGADLQKNRVVRLNLEDGSLKRLPFPIDGPSGPHTIDHDAEGNVWIANIEANEVGRLNTKTEKWQIWPGSSVGMNPHDFALNWKGEVEPDLKGRIWATLPGKNQLVALDPKTGKTQEFDLPFPEGDTPMHAVVYGAVIAPDRRHVWYTQLNGYLGSFNTEELRAETRVDFPQGTGPRRLSVTEEGIVWVPLFGSSQLLKFDGNANKELARYDLPDRGAASYNVRWDPKRKVVWLGTTNADVIYKFEPTSERFTVYPLPREQAYSRKLTVDDAGNVWTTYANIPTGSGPSMVVMLHPGD